MRQKSGPHETVEKQVRDMGLADFALPPSSDDVAGLLIVEWRTAHQAAGIRSLLCLWL